MDPLHGYLHFMQALNQRRVPDPAPHGAFTGITTEERAAMIQRIHRACQSLSMGDAILFHAVSLMDHALAMLPRALTPEEQKAMAQATFMLAAKYEQGDLHVPLSAMEQNAEVWVFKTLNFNMTVPNLLMYVRLISWEYSDSCERTRAMAKALLLAGIHDKSYIQYAPMELAAAAMVMACRLQEKDTEPILKLIGTDLLDCCNFLYHALETHGSAACVLHVESRPSLTGLLGHMRSALGLT